jgi:hypothetical protein
MYEVLVCMLSEKLDACHQLVGGDDSYQFPTGSVPGRLTIDHGGIRFAIIAQRGNLGGVSPGGLDAEALTCQTGAEIVAAVCNGGAESYSTGSRM